MASTARSIEQHWPRSTGRRSTASPKPRHREEAVQRLLRRDGGVGRPTRGGPRKADQIVRGTLSLPSGTGRTSGWPFSRPVSRPPRPGPPGRRGRRRRPRGQGQRGLPRFRRGDRHPDLMGQGGRSDVSSAPRAHAQPEDGHRNHGSGQSGDRVQGGRVEYRTDKVGNVHIRVGKGFLHREQLVTNVHAVIEELQRAKPASAKGRYCCP